MSPTSDCEAISVIGVAQPVNSITGVVFIAVAAIVVIGVAQRRLVSSATGIAVMVVANAVGTVAYHGYPGSLSHWIHDLALVGALTTIAGWHLGRLADGPRGTGSATTTTAGNCGAWIGTGVGVLIGGVAIAISHATTTVLAALALTIIIAAEIAARRRGLPNGFGWGLGIVVAAALTAYGVGRSESPLCSPDSVLQFHGVWHLLTGLAALVWADRALARHGPGVGSGVGRALADSLAGWAAVLLVRAFHRQIDVIGRDRVPADRPVLFVVNHANGFVDPMVLAATLHRLPRFIAKAALWKVLPARVALDALAVLPVSRRADGDDPHGNERTFGATTRALARRDRVAIFPEGTTGDRPALDRIHSGAARIALGAADAGVDSIMVVPVGLAFESRVTTRSRVAVRFGDPIDLDRWRSAEGTRRDTEDPHHESHRLTEVIEQMLTGVSPHYASVDEREQLRLAAAVSLQVERGTVPGFGAIEARASSVAKAPEPLRHQVIDALGRHALRREMVGLSDADLMPGPLRRGGVRLAVCAAVIAVFGPLLLTAVLINLPVIAAVQLGVMAVRETATKGTVRLLIGLVVGLLTWWVAAMLLADGALAVVATMMGLAVLSAVALAVWESVIDGIEILRMWFRRRDRAQLIGGLERTQILVAGHVDAALAATSPHADSTSCDLELNRP